MLKSLGKWAVIVNPYAGSCIKNKKWHQIEKELKKHNIDIDVIFTEKEGHLVEIAANLVENGILNMLIIGGDGSLNEVVHGIFTSSIKDKSAVTLAVIPQGTGNDWARYWGLNKNYKRTISKLTSGKRIAVDVGLLESEKGQRRYFLNALGGGFDAQVVRLANKLKHIFFGGAFVYTLAVIAVFLKHASQQMKITTENKELKDTVYTFSIGNGCYTGGGLKQNPEAVPTDGLFDLFVVKKMTFTQLLSALMCLFLGKIQQHPCVWTDKARSIKIDSDETIDMEADGISLNINPPYAVSIQPQAVNFLVP